MSEEIVSLAQISIQSLGQVGFRFDMAGAVIYIDPYLSNSVQEKESADLARLRPVPIRPETITDADWVLITHAHRDHCDRDTLLPLAAASPRCRFYCPSAAARVLQQEGIAAERIAIARSGQPLQVGNGLAVFPVPSAHPSVERDERGEFVSVGYVLQYGEAKIYHAGDTGLDDEVISMLQPFAGFDVAFIPVNEQNYFRARSGIIGNMSVREAFQFAEEIGALVVVPTHWDMFAANQVYKEEIELLYRKMRPNFKLIMDPDGMLKF